MSVVDYRCDAGPADEPFVEAHTGFSLSYVRRGSFGYHARGASFDLVAGSLLVGQPGAEYICTHDHDGGDECLSPPGELFKPLIALVRARNRAGS
jgi:AraC family transcriptional regulator